MKARWMVMIFLGFSLAASMSADAQRPDEEQAAEIAAIQQVRANLDATYNRRDAAAFSELFFEDADFQWHTGALLKDREEIRQHFANAFISMPADYRHITVFQRIRFLAPGMAIGDGTVVIARDGAADSEKPYLKVLLTCVGRKDNGRWRIAAVRLMPIIME
ncbi:MAG TPA: SgcJ/EcaC family oxidoreductase [Candidatus Binatia bacterium]|nr:SgcJ/EcaC family oxidoreductase [Candidatus Binatia bacterium]